MSSVDDEVSMGAEVISDAGVADDLDAARVNVVGNKNDTLIMEVNSTDHSLHPTGLGDDEIVKGQGLGGRGRRGGDGTARTGKTNAIQYVLGSGSR